MKKASKKTSKATREQWKQSPCSNCRGMCCKYITVEINEPKDDEDLDNIRWYMIHDGVGILVEGDQWMVRMNARCRYLQKDYTCGIYDRRPEACRQYDTENCDYRSVSEGIPTGYREFEDYAKLRNYVKRQWRKA
ncbi:MAG TPA: YkgJ family cysteine cluster protein [bacterium]|nr:YkgJ family cysteine cluster protein [bacterium]HQP98294.1 YkgJ family cysteine cluster protein [bacterium]